MFNRSCGVLLPLFSLPSPFGIGVIGKEAKDFILKIKNGGFSWWQMLPIVPPAQGYSPYTAFSSYAISPLFLDPRLLFERGLISSDDLAKSALDQDPYRVDYARLNNEREELFSKAYMNFDLSDRDFLMFCAENEYWLGDYSVFMAVKDSFSSLPFWQWPDEGLKRHDRDSIARFAQENSGKINYHKFLQFLLFESYRDMKRFANENGVGIIGDVPFYVSHDSADAWANTKYFLLDDNLMPTSVAGTPPDYFAPEGQRWGNPLYDVDAIEKDGFFFWQCRIGHNLSMFDAVRIDHFRAFDSFWSIDASEPTAKNGRWIKNRGKEFFDCLKLAYPDAKIIAEDLGTVTEGVTELLEYCGFPGMRVLDFAFDPGADSFHLPHNHVKNCVAYTGTHDNSTLLSTLWEMTPEQRNFALAYCGFSGDNWSEGGYSSSCIGRIISVLYSSPADLVIVPLQDLCGFGSDTRINVPGTPTGNWVYRASQDVFEKVEFDRYRNLAHLYKREYGYK